MNNNGTTHSVIDDSGCRSKLPGVILLENWQGPRADLANSPTTMSILFKTPPESYRQFICSLL
jgi:hypothetical protein